MWSRFVFKKKKNVANRTICHLEPGIAWIKIELFLVAWCEIYQLQSNRNKRWKFRLYLASKVFLVGCFAVKIKIICISKSFPYSSFLLSSVRQKTRKNQLAQTSHFHTVPNTTKWVVSAKIWFAGNLNFTLKHTLKQYGYLPGPSGICDFLYIPRSVPSASIMAIEL